MDSDDDIDINSPVEIGSLDDQETSDVIDPARKVRFEIKKAEVRTQREDNKDSSSPWKVKRLSLQAKITEDGVNGDGAQAGRVLFPELIIAFNQAEFAEQYASEWWQKKARGPAKEFFLALGFDVKALPKIDKEFLDGLTGRDFIADIQVEKVQEKTDEKNDKGKFIYKDTGEVRNKLGNYRAAA